MEARVKPPAPYQEPAPDPYSDHRPHRELGHQYALAALRDRRAFMAGELDKLERRRRYLKESMAHIDATLAFMAPGHVPTLTKAKFPRRKSKLFGAGKLNHLILGTFRKADGRALSLSDVVAGVVADGGLGPGAEAGLRRTVRANLLYLTSVRGLLEKEGDRAMARWRLV